MKMIAAFLLLLIGLGVIVLYFQPDDPLTSSDDLYIHQMTDEHLEPVPKPLTQEENNPKAVTTVTLLDQPTKTKEEVPFYDTKSDPSIQPIDPETDPANQIKKL